MIADDLVIATEDSLKILPAGRAFLRNACVAFDDRMNRVQTKAELFSKVV